MEPRAARPESGYALGPWILLGVGGLLAIGCPGLWYAVTTTDPGPDPGPGNGAESDLAPDVGAEVPTEQTVEAIANELAAEVLFSDLALKDLHQNHKTQLLRSSQSPQEAPDGLETARPGQWLNFESDGRLLFGCLRLPKGNGPHPAVVFCHGGFALGDSDIEDVGLFVEHGFAVFVPAWRGENGNAGSFELYYGEVDDAVAAMEFVARLPHVDENSIYLAGHSAGATIALLAAEMSERPQAVMACSPTLDMTRVVEVVGEAIFDEAPFAIRDTQETDVRSPGRFLSHLGCPAQLVYGDQELLLIAQTESVKQQLQQQGLNIKIDVKADCDHFTVLPEAIASAATFFSSQLATKRSTPVVTKAPFYDQCKNRIPGAKPIPSLTTAAQIVASIRRWNSQPDPGQSSTDWSGFVRWYSIDPYKEPRKPPFRVYPGNGHWMTSESFGNDFVLAALDGSRQHTLTGTVPNLLNGASDSRHEPAGVSPDGKQFAILWTGQEDPDDPHRSWLTIHQSSDGKVLHSAEDTHACQFLPGGRALLVHEKSVNPKTNMGQTVSVMTIATGAVTEAIALGSDDRFAPTPGGNHLVVLRTADGDTALDVYSAENAQLLSSGTYENVPLGLNIAISNDGREVFTVGQRRATIWDLQTGNILFSHRVSDVYQVANWLGDRRFLLLDQHMVLDRETGSRVATMAHRVKTPNVYAQHGPWLAAQTILPGLQLPRRMPVESFGKLLNSQLSRLAANRPLNVSVRLQSMDRDRLVDVNELINRGEVPSTHARDSWLEANSQNLDLIDFGVYQRIGAPHEKDAQQQANVVLQYSSFWTDAPVPKHHQLHGRQLFQDIPLAGIMNFPRAKLTLHMTGMLTPPASAQQLSRSARGGESSYVAENFKSVIAESEFDESIPFDVGLPWHEQAQATALTTALGKIKFPPADEFFLAPAEDTWRPMLPAAPGTKAVEPLATTAGFSLDSPFLLEGSQGATYVLHETLKDDEAQVGALTFVRSGDELVLLAGLQGPRVREYQLDGDRRDVAMMRAYDRIGKFQRDVDGRRWLASSGGDKIVIGDGTPDSMAVIVFSGSVDLHSPVMTADGKFMLVPPSKHGKIKQLAVWNLDLLLQSRRGDMVELPNAETVIDSPSARTYLPIPGSPDVIGIEHRAVHRINVADGSVAWRSEFMDEARSSLSGEILSNGKSALIHCRAGNEFVGVLIDLATGSLADQPPAKREQELRVYSPERTMFAAPFMKDHVAIYHAVTEEQIWRAQVGSLNGIPAQINSLECLVWSPDSRYLAAACNDSQRGTKLSALDVWDVSQVEAE